MTKKDISVTEFTCERDGLAIQGKKYRNTDRVNQPAVILCHGFLADQTSLDYEAMQYAIWGFAAFTFDFCGGGLHTISDGDTRDMSVLSEVEDLKAVFAYVKEQEYVRQDDITLAGHSQGGLVAAMCAAQLKEQVTRLILFYPAFCIPDDARKGRMQKASFDPKQVPEEFSCGRMKLGAVYAVTAMQLDPWKEITPYAGPVLILHGDSDKVVSPAYARRAVFEYNRGHKEHAQLCILSGAGHGFYGREQRAAAMEICRNFLHGRRCVLTFRTRRLSQEMVPDGLAYRCLRYPLEGDAVGPNFRGILDGGEERQDWNILQLLHRGFRFRADGIDSEGKSATVGVDISSNDLGKLPAHLTTDSSALAPLESAKCYAALEYHPEGFIIRIFAQV